jgi:hypothetical protein
MHYNGQGYRPLRLVNGLDLGSYIPSNPIQTPSMINPLNRQNLSNSVPSSSAITNQSFTKDKYTNLVMAPPYSPFGSLPQNPFCDNGVQYSNTRDWNEILFLGGGSGSGVKVEGGVEDIYGFDRELEFQGRY